MPPANSPVATSPRRTASPTVPRTPSPTFQSILREIGSPVQDLASTLTVQAEENAEAENLSFLRTPVEPPDEVSRETLTEQLRNHSSRSALNRSRYLGEANRHHTTGGERGLTPSHTESHDSWVQRMPSQTSRERQRVERRPSQQLPPGGTSWSDRRTAQAYGDRVPDQQSLYDWAPATAGEEDELEDFVAELHEEQPNANTEIIRLLSRAQTDAERGTRNHGSSSRASHTSQTPPQPPPPHHEPPSLRSAAILQSVRRNHRFSARSRDLMQRYVLDRERALQENDEQDRSNASRYLRAVANSNDNNRYEFNRLAWQASQRPAEHVPSHSEMVDYLQRRYPQDNTENNPSDFEKVIQHLYARKLADSDLGATVSCKDKGVAVQSVLKKIAIIPPPPTSFLSPGMIFSGFQQATSVNQVMSSGNTLHRLTNNHANASGSIATATQRTSPNPETVRPWLARNLTTTPPSFTTSSIPAPHSSTPNSHIAPNNHDRWTVKVAIHDIDYDTMSMQGTMEAYNVSTDQQSVGSNDKTFSTYLEGELIDFNHNTLLTESFRATPFIDSTYWRKLEPFASMTESEIGRNLLDPVWINRELLGKYVLMRWKEKCFVETTLTSAAGVRPGAVPRNEESRHDSLPTPPQHHGSSTATYLSGADNQNGLSISGFYYISLRRKDGRIEGLYFDPQSSPYQHLELRPESGTWGQGAWEFR